MIFVKVCWRGEVLRGEGGGFRIPWCGHINLVSRIWYTLTYVFSATHCNTLQHTASHCNTLQHTALHSWYTLTYVYTATQCNTLQHAATHCSTLQHTATHCNKLQHTATATHSWYTLTYVHTCNRDLMSYQVSNAHVYVNIGSDVHVCVCACVFVRVCVYVCIHSTLVFVNVRKWCVRVYMCACTCVFSGRFVGVFKHAYACVQVAHPCKRTEVNTLQHTATHCSTLQHTTTRLVISRSFECVWIDILMDLELFTTANCIWSVIQIQSPFSTLLVSFQRNMVKET